MRCAPPAPRSCAARWTISTCCATWQRVAGADLDQVGQARGLEVAARPRQLARLELGGDDAAAAVVAQGRGQVDGRQAERGAELDDVAGAAAARQHVQQRAGAARDRQREVLQAHVEVEVVDLAAHQARLLRGGHVREGVAQRLARGIGLGEQAVQQRCDWGSGEGVHGAVSWLDRVRE